MIHRTQHRRRWRGKRMSMRVRYRLTDSPTDIRIAELIATAIAGLWRRGLW